MKNRLALGLLILLVGFLHAEVLEFTINYLGLGVVDVVMVDDSTRLTVTAKSTSFAGIFSEMDNRYISDYRGDYLPDRYIKDIRQHEYSEDRTVSYDREACVANRISRIDSTRNASYPILMDSRDFFSALYFLRHADLDSVGVVTLDANTLIWNARITIEEKEVIRTKLGKVQTVKVRIDFQRTSERKKERSDMLTNNLVNEEVPMYIWFTCDDKKLPIRAKFASSPFAVTWTLTGHQE